MSAPYKYDVNDEINLLRIGRELRRSLASQIAAEDLFRKLNDYRKKQGHDPLTAEAFAYLVKYLAAAGRVEIKKPTLRNIWHIVICEVRSAAQINREYRGLTSVITEGGQRDMSTYKAKMLQNISGAHGAAWR